MSTEENDSYRKVDSTEYQNVQKSFDSVEDRIIQSDIESLVAMYNPKADPYRINQTYHYTERRD
jgi:hypothetical protein